MTTIAAAFEREEDARAAYTQLQDAGVPGDDVGLILREHASEHGRREELVEDANGWIGASLGATAGGVGGWLAGAAAAGAAVAIPVVGPVLALGALAGIISAAGGTLGWLAGGLVGRGMSHDEAAFCQAAVERGCVLLTVHTNEASLDRVRGVLRRNHGTEYKAS